MILEVGIGTFVTWYQKKIGTYDKEPWEKTVEQKILDGFSSVTLRNAKLKTELIDVDLVRGSTFPKAKPKQSLLTVIRFALLRYFFLPLYAKWWVKQTSPNAFGLLLFLYILQFINWAIYTLNVNQSAVGSTNGAINLAQSNTNETTKANATTDKAENEHIISLAELFIPMALSLLLSLIHSQIVATNNLQGAAKCKRRRYSFTGQNGRQGKLRRRKKLVKTSSNSILFAQQRKTAPFSKYAAAAVNEPTLNQNKDLVDISNSSSSSNDTKINSTSLVEQTTDTTKLDDLISKTIHMKHTTSNRSPHHSQLKLELNDAINGKNSPELECHVAPKRNVNWQSPVHKYATTTQEKQQQTSPQSPKSISTTSSSHTTSQVGENSSVSSNTNSPSCSPIKTVRIDDCVQEFYDDLINRTSDQRTRTNSPQELPNAIEANVRAEDDGFESLNGKSSSGEDTNASPHTPRLRANVLTNPQRVQQVTETLQNPSLTLCYQHISESAEYLAQLKNSKSREVSSDETEEEGDDGELISSPASPGNASNYNECTTSATEWLGITTNSDECSYSSEYDNSDGYKNHQYSDENGYDLDFTPTITSDRISCTVWEHREIKKAQMSVLEISSAIIENVESMPETNDYIYIGIFFSLILSLIPCFCRLCEITLDSEKSSEINYFDLPMMLWEKASFSFIAIFRFAFGDRIWERTVLVIGFIQRLFLTMILFMIFAVAERSFKQRFLYAKLFSHLTSSRRARKSNLPHFRLNKVRNIKTWLSVRSYLKKRGPQRSVDIIVSAAFIVTLLLLAFLSVEWLKDSVHLHSHLNLEALMWSSTIGIFLLRFMTLGNKIHHKYRSVSVLITEQINLYLQIEKKPKKKDELMVSNSVLKLAADLLKELETPFKISGLSANPYLFTTIKVVILSALSGVLSEMLGFKLKLHKIKIK